MKIFEKKTVVKIEDEDLKDAKLSSVDFADVNIRKRAFADVLGARLAMKLLFSQKIEADNLYSLYTIHNILEELDIADIYFQGIRIDIRLVFNPEEIFVPKNHFEYDLVPHLYLVLQLNRDMSSAEFLGFFEPKDLNKKDSNKDFYFYEQSKLHSPEELKDFLDNYKIEADSDISEENSEEPIDKMFLYMVDKNISQKDKLFLLKQLANNFALREKLVEFENFEIISKAVAQSDDLIQDGLLDIVGAQQVVAGDEEVNAVLSEEEFAEEAGLPSRKKTKMGLDSLIEDAGEEVILSAPEFERITDEEAFEEADEIIFESDLKDDEIIDSSEKAVDKEVVASGLNVIAAGAALGGAIIAGGAIAASASAQAQGELIKGGAELLSSGLDLVGDSIQKENLPKEKPLKKKSIKKTSNYNTEAEEKEVSPELDLQEEDSFPDDTSVENEVLNDNIKAEEQEVLPELDLQEEGSFPDEKPAENEVLDDKIETEEQILPMLKLQEEDSITEELLPENEVLNDTIEAEEQEILPMLKLQEEGSFTEGLTVENEVLDYNIEAEEKETLPELKTIKEEILEESENLEVGFGVTFNENEDVFPELDSQEEDSFDELLDIENLENLELVEETSFNEVPVGLNMVEEAVEKVEDKIEQVESNDSVEEVYNLENFDFNILKDDSPEIDLTQDEEVELTEDDEDSYDENQDQSDEIISQVDDFLKDMELSEEQKNLIANEFADFDFDEPSQETFEVQTEATSTALTQADLPEEDQDLLKVLFEKEKLNEKSEVDFEVGIERNKTPLPNKKMVVAASIASVVLASLIVVGGVAMHNNNSKSDFPKNLNNPQIEANGQSPAGLPQENQMPDANQQGGQQPIDQVVGQVPPGVEQQAQPDRDMNKAVSDAFLSEPVNATISKVAWEVPEELAYNDSFRKYLQMAGKNLKLNIQNNLLLATEMAYSNKVVVDLQIARDGGLQTSNITVSSGSKQIDKIVLQSVKETLQYLKMPSSELNGQSVVATLIINF